MSKSGVKGKSKGNKAGIDPNFVGNIVNKSLNQVIHESMMPYSEFVIMDRALPRVEDGLKPVQRRVLYSMLEVGVTPDKPYRKSARIVGDCMGKYHPHGDKSIYDTMVRMAQSFNMGETLVDGHGNFGSVDGDGAAAMRYTEARLSPISLELLKDIDKDTVSWSFNFDDSTKEPDMLPGRFPNLLVNGSTGIAVGLATNIPTHNLGETIDAVCAFIDNKKITLDEILKLMPAPDFSTGGYILDSSELKQIYETGRGRVIMRAKHHIENTDNGRKNIVITEIPYQVNKSNMLQKIAKLKENDDSGVYAGIYEIVDESDRTGTRAVLKLRKDTNVNLLLQSLYKYSDLQLNFNVNMVAIAGGKPKLLSLMEIIEYYVNYQKQVVYNRTKYDLAVSEKRAHILAGLIVAIKNIDEVIKIIKQSKSVNEARITLQEVFILTEMQAQAILDMRLSRLTNLEVNKIETELKGLLELIEKLKRILASDKLQLNLVKSEMMEIKERYATERKSEIISDDVKTIAELMEEVSEETAEYEHVIYSAGNTIKTVMQKNYNLSVKELGANANLTEVPHIDLTVLNNKSVYLLTNLGNCHKVRVKDIPNCKFKDRGELIYNIVKNYEQHEKVVAIFDLDESNDEDELVFVTKQGFVKISKANEYLSTKQSISAIKLKENDELIYVVLNNKEQNLTMFTNMGYGLTFEKKDISVSGRVSMGVKGIGLSDDDFVVNAFQIHNATAFVLFTENGFAKVIKNSEVPLMARTRKGLKMINGVRKDMKLVNAYLLDKNINFVTESSNGDLGYVVNRKLVLEDRLGEGKNVLPTKLKSVTLNSVYRYEVRN